MCMYMHITSKGPTFNLLLTNLSLYFDHVECFVQFIIGGPASMPPTLHPAAWKRNQKYQNQQLQKNFQPLKTACPVRTAAIDLSTTASSSFHWSRGPTQITSSFCHRDRFLVGHHGMWSISARRCASICGSVHPATSPVNAVRTQSEDWLATWQQQTETAISAHTKLYPCLLLELCMTICHALIIPVCHVPNRIGKQTELVTSTRCPQCFHKVGWCGRQPAALSRQHITTSTVFCTTQCLVQEQNGNPQQQQLLKSNAAHNILYCLDASVACCMTVSCLASEHPASCQSNLCFGVATICLIELSNYSKQNTQKQNTQYTNNRSSSSCACQQLMLRHSSRMAHCHHVDHITASFCAQSRHCCILGEHHPLPIQFHILDLFKYLYCFAIVKSNNHEHAQLALVQALKSNAFIVQILELGAFIVTIVSKATQGPSCEAIEFSHCCTFFAFFLSLVCSTNIVCDHNHQLTTTAFPSILLPGCKQLNTTWTWLQTFPKVPVIAEQPHKQGWEHQCEGGLPGSCRSHGKWGSKLDTTSGVLMPTSCCNVCNSAINWGYI